MIGFIKDFFKLIFYGYLIYVGISILGMFILMGMMYIFWT